MPLPRRTSTPDDTPSRRAKDRRRFTSAGLKGDGKESSDATQNAIDGNPSTVWDTETYQGGFEGSNKGGVGLYVDAGSPVAAKRMEVVTSTPGYKAAVYAANTVPGSLRGWTKVSPVRKVGENQTFRLDTSERRYKFYLLWISELPEESKADVMEMSLRK